MLGWLHGRLNVCLSTLDASASPIGTYLSHLIHVKYSSRALQDALHVTTQVVYSAALHSLDATTLQETVSTSNGVQIGAKNVLLKKCWDIHNRL